MSTTTSGSDDPLSPEQRALLALPHRPPMRLVEEVVAIVPGECARTRRVAHAGDWYFQGHFPDQPIVPAVILVELLAQTGGLAACSGDHPAPAGGLRLAALGGFKFPAPAGPGAVLEATARVAGRAVGLIKIEGEVEADGRLVATGSLTLAPAPANQDAPRAREEDACPEAPRVTSLRHPPDARDTAGGHQRRGRGRRAERANRPPAR